jgi:hypothetical protein
MFEIEQVINLKTAKTLGLDVPVKLLSESGPSLPCMPWARG